MNQQQPIHRRRLTRAEIRRRRRNRAIRRIAGLTLVVCVAVGGVSFLLSRRKAPVPTADAAGSAANSAASSLPSAAPSSKAESSAVSGAAAESVESRDNLLGLTNDILTCHSKWNRLLLNRARFYKASFFNLC